MKTYYTKELKQQLVKRYYNGESASDVCLHTGVPRSTFYTWVKSYKANHTASSLEICAVDYARQKKHTQKLENMIKVLQIVNCTIASPLKVKLGELTQLYGEYSVHVLCDSLDVARGTFYNHVFRNKKGNNSYKARREQLSRQIKEIYEESNQIYGARKIRAVLQTRGINTTDKMVLELMQSMNLHSIRGETKRQYNRFLKEGKKDVLKLNFTAKAPNKVWVSDVTYFRTCDTTRYICVIIDLYSRKVISYKISQKHSTQLITSTFKLAYEDRQPDNDLIFHSDRGVQYAAFAFRKLLKTLNVTQSFSPTGRPCHNAVMESFFATLKKEELYRINYHSVREFEQSVKDFIKRYNKERPHVTLRYKTPNAYEQVYFER
ncbi:MAG: IS3 family transposase [Clostridiales bacterium]|nr:IS3 family transposase [Clostridiales bacterium]